MGHNMLFGRKGKGNTQGKDLNIEVALCFFHTPSQLKARQGCGLDVGGGGGRRIRITWDPFQPLIDP